MFINPHKLQQLANHGVDVVVVGAGPAGITLALKLALKKKKVLLIEAGGLNYPTEKENDPYNGQSASRPYPIGASRLRFFGGTSNHWGGWVRPLDKEDFDVNEGIPYSGWPISYDSLTQHYAVAHSVCEVTGSEYRLNKLADTGPLNLLSFNKDSEFRNSMFRFSPPTRFGERYRRDIIQSPYIYCALNTQLLRVERAENGRCQLVLLNSESKEITVVSHSYVLAMGGIENARTLLYSNSLNRPNFGGKGDWLGRCFMDHFSLTTSLVLARPEINYDRTPVKSGDIMARITPSTKALQVSGANNLMIDIYPTKADKTLGSGYFENQGFFQGSSPGWHYALRVVTGSRPNRNSRILLESQKDINGIPRVLLDWNIVDDDFQNAFNFVQKLSTTIGASGQGRLKIQMVDSPEITKPLGVGMHHIGTTRMAKNEHEGAIDENCKVFATSDLYVAGSSIFPTCGYSNPTLTIVALANRLADHIAKGK